jgi:hypothetical protein
MKLPETASHIYTYSPQLDTTQLRAFDIEHQHLRLPAEPQPSIRGQVYSGEGTAITLIGVHFYLTP